MILFACKCKAASIYYEYPVSWILACKDKVAHDLNIIF